MYNLIPPIIIIVSLGGILVIFLRKITKLPENTEELLDARTPNSSTIEQIYEGGEINNETAAKSGRIKKVITRTRERIADKINFNKIRLAVIQFLEKTLRKVKVNLMKIENIAAELTKKLSAKARDFNLENNSNKNEEKIEAPEEPKETTSTTPPIQEAAPILENPIVEETKEKVKKVSGILRKAISKRPQLRLRRLRSEKKPVDKAVKNPEKEFIDHEKEYIYRIAKNPVDTESYIALGYLYLEKGNLEDAKQSFQHALKIDPYNRKARGGVRFVEKKQTTAE